ncbi:outer membrane protein assembly factor BamC [Kaarinaea lacus]
MGLTSGCGSMSQEEKHAYRNAESIKPIEMPSGLEMTRSKESLEIPEQTATKLASVDELERPPKIIESVDLKMLDDDKPRRADTKKGADKEKEPEKENPVSNEDATGNSVAKRESMRGSLSITVTKNTDGDSLLIVDHDFEHVWPQVKPALIELGFKIDDASQGGQLYAISKELPTLNLSGKPVHPGDEKPEVKEEYQIHVKPVGEKTEITVHNVLGQVEGSGLADHLLLQIKEIMENPNKALSDKS